MTATPPKVYLAGPEVFFANGEELIGRKKDLAREYGFEPWESDHGAFPEDRIESGLFISAMNEDAMRACDFCIANMTPFRGISTDVGTAYEIGFMAALGKVTFGYSNDPRHYNERASAEWYNGAVAEADDGLLRASDGQMVEDHLMADNLMLDGGIAALGGKVVRPEHGERLDADDLAMFEVCLKTAWRHFNPVLR